MKTSKVCRLWLFAGAALCMGAALTLEASQPVLYRLTQESTIQVDYGGLDRPAILGTLRGTFRLIGQPSPQDWATYEVADMSLEGADVPGGALRILGFGTYRVGGRSDPMQQEMTIHSSILGDNVDLKSEVGPVGQPWPVLDITVHGSNTSVIDSPSYTLRVVAVPELRRWHYQLLPGTTLYDDCYCGRPTLPYPVYGGFDLALMDENPLTSRYHVFDLDIRTYGSSPVAYRLTGEGDYEIGGEVAVQQKLILRVNVQTPLGTTAETFVSELGIVSRQWPMLAIRADEPHETRIDWLWLDLYTAPFREIWFTSGTGMTSGNRPAPEESRISSGDLLSSTGRVVKRNADLVRSLGPEPGGDYGVDALDIGPGGEVLFSLTNNEFSETLGVVLQEGDLLSEAGRVAQSNQQLMSAFGQMPPAPDAGLDAVHVMPDGEVLFSIRQDVFSESRGITVHHGDLLSNRGEVRRSNQDLLVRFKPQDPKLDYGLDAVYVWPSGEVWFSTEEGFNDGTLGAVTNGDLLSDHGYVVYRNLDLLNPFAPIEDLANFGLDGIYVVTDAAAPPGEAMITGIKREASTITLNWKGRGSVFQLERTLDLAAPFDAVGPITTDRSHTENLPDAAHAFYRVRQW